jgi:hypothetical protein
MWVDLNSGKKSQKSRKDLAPNRYVGPFGGLFLGARFYVGLLFGLFCNDVFIPVVSCIFHCSFLR